MADLTLKNQALNQPVASRGVSRDPGSGPGPRLLAPGAAWCLKPKGLRSLGST